METKELKLVETKTSNALKVAEEIMVENDNASKYATEVLSEIKKLSKYIKEQKDKIAKPIKEGLAKAVEPYDRAFAIATQAEGIIKKKIVDYMVKLEDLKRKEEEKIAARVEKGTLKEETAIRKMGELENTPTSVKTEAGNVAMRTIRQFEIENENLIPDEYWILDTAKIGKVIRAGGTITGIKVVETKTLTNTIK